MQGFLTAPTLHATFQLPLSLQAHDELKLLQLDMAAVVLEDQDDVWSYCWGSNVFKTTAYYQFVFRDVVALMAFKWLWKTKCTPKIKVFGWFLLSDRLNTRNMLKRRHYNIGTNLDCLLCGQHVEETVEHLFFHCTFSKECWHLLNISWDVQGDRSTLVENLKTQHPRKMIMEIFLTAAWSLWKERNNNYFRHVSPSITSWFNRFKEDFDKIRYRLPDHERHVVSSFLQSLPQQA